jgi:catechol 2,3-dioxygenase-like lactoylglutathione lyase family enzyme
MIRGLHHAQITVPVGAEDAARRFYCGELGLREVPKPAILAVRGGFWLELGTMQVHVGTEDGVDRRRSKTHLAFLVDDLAAVRAVAERLGLEPRDGEAIPGLARFECRDPFGNRMEFVQRTEGDAR